MRIVCDSCGTKYSISDDKVRGKVFKIRCKNCSHVIIVRGDQNAAAGVAAPAPEAASEAVWYVVRGGQQDGPYSVADVEQLLAQAEIGPDTYSWREGFADWVPLSTAEGLSHLVVPQPAATVPVSAAAVSAAASSMRSADVAGYHDEGANSASAVGHGFDDDFEATRVVDHNYLEQQRQSQEEARQLQAQQEAAAASAAAASVAAASVAAASASAASASAPGDNFDAPTSMLGGAAVSAASIGPVSMGPSSLMDEGEVPSLSGLASLSGSLDAALSEPVPSVARPNNDGALRVKNGHSDDPDLVGQRNEDSVLFSLQSLQSNTVTDEGSAPANTEASGLIDIRALSASAAAVDSGRSEGPGAAPDPFAGPGPSSSNPGPAIQVPIGIPMGTRKSNTGLYIGIAAALLLILLLVGAVIALIVTREDSQTVTKERPAAGAGEVAGDGAAVAANDKGAEDAEKGAKDDEKEGGAEGEGDDDGAKDEGEGVAAKDGEEEGDGGEEGDGDEEGAGDEESGDKDSAVAANKPKEKKTPEEARRDREARERRLEELAARKKEAGDKPRETARKTTERTKPRKGGGDAIDDILGGIGGGKKPPASKEPAAAKKDPPAAAPPAAAPKKLDKAQVQRVIRGAYGRVAACNNGPDKKSGTVTVRFTIQPSGSVGGAQVTGGFAGTPVGGCVSRVVRGLRFPAFGGSPITITFPFVLR